MSSGALLMTCLRSRRRELFILRFARRNEPDKGQDRCRRQVIADVSQSVPLRQPCRDVRGERGAENACEAVSRNTAPEKRNPTGAPSCGNIPYQARLPGGAFSTAS